MIEDTIHILTEIQEALSLASFVHFFGGSTGAVYYWTIMCGARHSITTVAKTVNNVKMNRQSLDFTEYKFVLVTEIAIVIEINCEITQTREFTSPIST